MYQRKPSNPWLRNPLPNQVEMSLCIQRLKNSMPNNGIELPVGIRKETARYFRVVMTPEFHALFNKCRNLNHIN